MTRQRFEGLRRELIRRTLVKFDTSHTNKIGKCMRDAGRVKWDECRKQGNNSYDDIWNSDGFKSLRSMVGM